VSVKPLTNIQIWVEPERAVVMFSIGMQQLFNHTVLLFLLQMFILS